MFDLNALRNKVKEVPKAPAPTAQELITSLKEDLEGIQKKLNEFEVTPPIVSEEERKDGTSPESIIKLWKLRLTLTQKKLKELEEGQDSTYTVS